MEVEPFESYFARWPKSLAAMPKSIIEDWVYRHWRDFSAYWLDLEPHTWSYELAQFPNECILSIGHVGRWIADLDAEGVEYVSDAPRSKTKLAQYMLREGTFPVPILVAENAGAVVHPRTRGERMKEPYQLIEGHCRLACLRGMIQARHPNLLQVHRVWVATIPRK